MSIFFNHKKIKVTLIRVALLTLMAVLLVTGEWGTAQVYADDPVITPIYDIQGAAHTSPFENQTVTTTGVVTAIAFNGYYVQDPNGDGDPNTSDGIFVFQFGGIPSIGDFVQITDEVTEFVPGGCDTGNLSTTQMSFPTLVNLGTAPIPAPVVIGTSGRVPPNVVTHDELPAQLQPSFCPGGGALTTFDPANDGIDFYESLEGMLVTVEDAQAVSATRRFGTFSAEFFTVPNRGDKDIIEPNDAMTQRGGILLQPDPDNNGDQNPERVQVQLSGTPLYPGDMNLQVSVGDLVGDVTGVVGYSFGNYEINAIHEIAVVNGGLTPETSKIEGAKKRVTVASYNVLNLSPDSSDDAQRAKLADQIVNALNSPDVIALQEIQDNSGDTDNGITAADQTLQALVNAIASAGGPNYDFFDVAPADGTSGGIPGGNIRNAFLYNPSRVNLVGFVSLTPAELTSAGVSNPAAFTDARDPLAATFEFNNSEFTVINNHLTSRFGSTPIFGGPQPFVQAGEDGGVGREDQTAALNEYVDSLLAADEDANIMVVGDLNTFEWTNDLLEILPGEVGVLTNLVPFKDKGPDKGLHLGQEDFYSFIFDGNSQMLDHFFVTSSLLPAAKFDVVHVNVDFPRTFSNTTASDHEPLVGQFMLGAGDKEE